MHLLWRGEDHDEVRHRDDLLGSIAPRIVAEVDGLSYEEIAETMSCPIGTVRSRIFRAREAVALKLRPLLDIAPDRRW